MTGCLPRIPTCPRKPHLAPRLQARDVRPAVEQGGQAAGGVGDVHGQHRVPLDRADLHRPHPALDRGPSRPVQRADRVDPGGRRGPVVAGCHRAAGRRAPGPRRAGAAASGAAAGGAAVTGGGRPGVTGRRGVGASPGPVRATGSVPRGPPRWRAAVAAVPAPGPLAGPAGSRPRPRPGPPVAASSGSARQVRPGRGAGSPARGGGRAAPPACSARRTGRSSRRRAGSG